jgi:hypothetical protein
MSTGKKERFLSAAEVLRSGRAWVIKISVTVQVSAALLAGQIPENELAYAG